MKLVPGLTLRSSRLRMPSFVGGIVIGGLLVGALAPLIGNRLEVATSGTPGVFSEEASRAPDALGDGAGDTGASLDSAVPSPDGDPETSETASADGGSTNAGSGPSAAATDSPVERTASDVGVSAKAMTVGLMLLKCDGCAAFGYSYPTTGPEIAQAYVDDINSRGGINGRQVQLAVEEFDQLEDAVQGGSTQRAACIELTERQPLFVALAVGVTQLDCLYDEHELPVVAATVGNGTDPGTFNESDGRLWTVSPTPRRMLVNWADQLVASGTLSRDEPFGIVTIAAQEFDLPIRDVLVPHLESLGYPAAHVTVLPADSAASATARATEGASMRRKGIDTVLLAMDFLNSSLWIQEAERNRWRPQYLLSDYATPADESTGSLQPASFAGALAVSAVPEQGAALTEADLRCNDVWEAAAGRAVAGPEEQTLVGFLCTLFTTFERGATRAGPNPTRSSYIQGLASIGAIPVAGVVGGNGSFGGKYAFGPVKWSAVDEYIVKRWNGERYVRVAGPTRMTA